MIEVSRPQSGSALWAHGLLLSGAGAAIFLAGGAPQGNLGVFLLCAGVALVACPPRVRVEWPLWAAAGGLVGCGGLAFLPWRWWPVPLWRRAIASAPAVTLPGSITAAPMETAFWLALLALSLVIGLFALSQPVRARGMIWLVLAAVTMCAVYAALAMDAKVTGWHYPFSGGATFGFLPNRNHTATLLVTGSVLATGLMSVAFRDRRWVVADLAVAGALVCVAALGLFSTSRAGVLILLAGVGLWLAGLGGRHRPGRLLAAAAVATLAVGGVFLAVKSPARDRVLGLGEIGLRGAARRATPTPAAAGTSAVAAPNAGRDAAADPPAEFRVRVYQDTLAMIGDQPWTGTGLGTFAGVFPQYRRASLVAFNALHPESDWLMLVAEAGLPALACAAALVGLAARRLRGLREHPYWPLRWGCAAAAAAALLHSAVDVPAHRAAVGWWLLALVGLALQRQPAEGAGGTGTGDFNAKTRRSGRLAKEAAEERVRRVEGAWQGRVQHGVFVLAGVGSLALGETLVRAEWFHGPDLPPYMVAALPQRLYDAYQHQEYAAGTALARRTLRDAPLTASAYYYLGVFLAVSDEEGVDQQVDEMFQAERTLDPVMPDVAAHEGQAWAGYDPARETALGLEELARVERINQAQGRDPREGMAHYQNLVTRAAREPDAQRDLLAVVRPDRRFEAWWTQWVSPVLARTRVEPLAADEAWVRGGGTMRPDWSLARESAGPSRPAVPGEAGGQRGEWEGAGWAVRLRQMVYAGQYERAVGELARRDGISLALPGEAGAEAGEGGSGAAGAFVAAWRAGDQAGASRGLAAASVDVNDPTALEAWRWRAALAARDGKWKEAWLTLERYVRHTRQMEWP